MPKRRIKLTFSHGHTWFWENDKIVATLSDRENVGSGTKLCCLHIGDDVAMFWCVGSKMIGID